MSILDGSVVFIDDEWDVDGKDANHFYVELRDAGRPIALYKTLPDETHFDHWEGLALLLVDWDLVGSESRVPGATDLQEEPRKEMVEFLNRVIKRFYCAVYVVSTDPTDKVESGLKETKGFSDELLGARIKVRQKSQLRSGLLSALESEISADPGLSVLRAWEKEHQRAKNQMLNEFAKLAPNWPAYIVRATKHDGADPAHELMETLYANLRHRVDPQVLDQERYIKEDGTSPGETLRKVAQGRTMLLGDFSPKMVYPGDLFCLDGDPEDTVWINVSPVCQTVARPMKVNGVEQKDGDGNVVVKAVRLHLLKGTRQEMPPSSKKLEKLRKEMDGPNGAVIYTLFDGHPYAFEFDEAQIMAWEEVKARRVGRVLPPFITRVQQKHAAYIQSEGLPRVEFELYQGS